MNASVLSFSGHQTGLPLALKEDMAATRVTTPNATGVGAQLKANKLQALHVTDLFTLNETLEPSVAHTLGNVH